MRQFVLVLLCFSSPFAVESKLHKICHDDECGEVECKNGGTCMNATLSLCGCSGNFAGRECEIPLECTATSCGANAECLIQDRQVVCACKYPFQGDAKTGCNVKVKEACLNGDPHYRTFDGTWYDYMGTCPVVVTEPCNPAAANAFTDFSVRSKSEMLPGTRVSVVDSAEIRMFGKIIFIDRNQRVTVDNSKVALPYYFPSQANASFTIEYRGGYVVVRNKVNVQIRFALYELCVAIPDVPETNGNQTMCGLFGNVDGACGNDLRMKNGASAVVNENCYAVPAEADKFGDTWIVDEYSGPDDEEKCLTCETGKKITAGDTKNACNRTLAEASCVAIKMAMSAEGVFGSCSKMGKEFLQKQYDGCIFDVCADASFKCKALERMEADCAVRVPSATHADWRSSLQCPAPVCPAHSTYSRCSSACPQTCSSPELKTTCNFPCSSGCSCEAGYLQDSSDPTQIRCVKVADCPSKNATPPPATTTTTTTAATTVIAGKAFVTTHTGKKLDVPCGVDTKVIVTEGDRYALNGPYSLTSSIDHNCTLSFYSNVIGTGNAVVTYHANATDDVVVSTTAVIAASCTCKKTAPIGTAFVTFEGKKIDLDCGNEKLGPYTTGPNATKTEPPRPLSGPFEITSRADYNCTIRFYNRAGFEIRRYSGNVQGNDTFPATTPPIMATCFCGLKI